MSNMVTALNESMNNLRNLYKDYSREQLEGKRSEAQQRVTNRIINDTLDDSLISDNLDNNIIAVCNELLNVKKLRDFKGFSMVIDGIAITYMSKDNYILIDDAKGLNIRVEGYRITGKGAKKYKDIIEDTIAKFESYIWKNKYN